MKAKRSHLIFRQPFRKPFHSAKGVWEERTSLVLRQDGSDGCVFFGEVAPLQIRSDWILKRAIQEAKQWCEYKDDFDEFEILRPALSSLKSSIWKEKQVCSTLPETARIWAMNQSLSHGVIKRKIGLCSMNEELPEVLAWLDSLPEEIKVRLDPNESFSRNDLLKWTDALGGRSCIQFIEQPTGMKDDDWLIEHSFDSPIPIALDEALLRMESPEDLYQIPRNLFLVIKPVLFKDWDVLYALLADSERKIIFSTAFESPFGYEALVRLSSRTHLAPGLERSCFDGNTHEFAEHHVPSLSCPAVSNRKLSHLWNLLVK